MGGVDKIDQQLDSINIIRKSFKWYHKVFFSLFSVAMLSSHKIYKEKGGKYDFLQFVHAKISYCKWLDKDDKR